MDGLVQHSLVVSRGLKYNYYSTQSTDNSKLPLILLLHGFPDDAFLWNRMLPQLSSIGLQLLVPDLLGAGGTSKPLEPESYNSESMSQDLIEILDKEQIKSVVAVGHDWGSFMASRLYNWHPDRVAGLVCLNMAYLAPSIDKAFDLKFFNDLMEKMTGYPRLAYQEFMVEPDAAMLLEKDPARTWSMIHGDADNWMRDINCVPGAIRDFLQSNRHISPKPYAQDPALIQRFVDRMQNGGIAGQLRWYYAFVHGQHFDHERKLDPERLICNVPMLFVGCSGDAVCLPDLVKGPQARGQLPHLTIRSLDCGHWSPLEEPQEVAKIIIEWLNENVPK